MLKIIQSRVSVIFTPMFTAVLFIIAQRWKPKCPLANGWINKMWYILNTYNGILFGLKKERNCT